MSDVSGREEEARLQRKDADYIIFVRRITSTSIDGLVVKSVVAIDGPRVRFTVNASFSNFILPNVCRQSTLSPNSLSGIEHRLWWATVSSIGRREQSVLTIILSENTYHQQILIFWASSISVFQFIFTHAKNHIEARV